MARDLRNYPVWRTRTYFGQAHARTAMEMNHVRKSEGATFYSFSVAVGEAVCTIVEGSVAIVQYVLAVIKEGCRHSLQRRSGENSEDSLSLGSHTARMNSPDKSCEQSTEGRHGHPQNILWSRGK